MTDEKLIDRVLSVAVDGAMNIAKTREEKSLITTIIGIGAGQNAIPIIGQLIWKTDDEKEAKLEAIKQLFAKHQVVAYATVSEAWMADVQHLSTEAAQEARARDMDNRIEVAIISAIDGTEKRVRIYKIIRNDDQSITDLIEMREYQSMAKDMQGRMTELLDL